MPGIMRLRIDNDWLESHSSVNQAWIGEELAKLATVCEWRLCDNQATSVAELQRHMMFVCPDHDELLAHQAWARAQAETWLDDLFMSCFSYIRRGQISNGELLRDLEEISINLKKAVADLRGQERNAKRDELRVATRAVRQTLQHNRKIARVGIPDRANEPLLPMPILGQLLPTVLPATSGKRDDEPKSSPPLLVVGLLT